MFLKKEDIKILSIFNEKWVHKSCPEDLCIDKRIEKWQKREIENEEIDIKSFDKLLSYWYIIKRGKRTSYNYYSLSWKGEEIFYAYQKGKLIWRFWTIKESYGELLISILALVIAIIALCK